MISKCNYISEPQPNLQRENDIRHNSRMYNLCIILLILSIGSMGIRTLINIGVISMLAYSEIVNLEGLMVDVKKHKLILRILSLLLIVCNIITIMIN